jgi:hypothetical protein
MHLPVELTVQSTTIYPLRNGSDLIIPFCRLSITTESFIPSTVKLCNRLDQFDRNLNTLTKFKKAIRKEQSDNTKREVNSCALYSRRNKFSKIIWCMSIFYIIKVCSNEGTSVFVTAMLFSLYLTCSCLYPSNLMVTAAYICILIIENVPSTNLALRMLQTSWVRFQ